MKAVKTTLITNMSNADYHAQSAFSSSQIKDILRTPAHFYAKHMGEKPQKPRVLVCSWGVWCTRCY